MTDTDRTPAEVDLVRALEQTGRDRRWWQNAAIAAWASFAGLFAVSFVQFGGTFTTCRLMEEARQEAERARQDNARMVEELRQMHHEAVRAGTSAVAAERKTRTYTEAGWIDRLQEVLADVRSERKSLSQDREALRKDQIMINGRVYSTRLPGENDP